MSNSKDTVITVDIFAWFDDSAEVGSLGNDHKIMISGSGECVIRDDSISLFKINDGLAMEIAKNNPAFKGYYIDENGLSLTLNEGFDRSRAISEQEKIGYLFRVNLDKGTAKLISD